MMKSLIFFFQYIWGVFCTQTYKRPHTGALQRCLFTPLTRGNNTECVKALHGEKENKTNLCVSAGPASRLGRTTVWDITQENAPSLRIQQATLMCKCMQEKFQKSRNYWAKWGSCTQIVGIMNNYRTFYGTFLNFLWNNDFSGLIEENPNVVWSYCSPVARGRSYLCRFSCAGSRGMEGVCSRNHFP